MKQALSMLLVLGLSTTGLFSASATEEPQANLGRVVLPEGEVLGEEALDAVNGKWDGPSLERPSK